MAGNKEDKKPPKKKIYIPIVASSGSGDSEKRDSRHKSSAASQARSYASAENKPYKVTREVWNDIKSRNKGRAGSNAKVWMMEELEPYMGSFPTTGDGGRGLFPGLIPGREQQLYSGGSGGGGRGGGGGGGGGGGSLPLPPPPFKIRTTTGQRLTPYWESEPDFVQGWNPRLTVLGNTQAW